MATAGNKKSFEVPFGIRGLQVIGDHLVETWVPPGKYEIADGKIEMVPPRWYDPAGTPPKEALRIVGKNGGVFLISFAVAEKIGATL